MERAGVLVDADNLGAHREAVAAAVAQHAINDGFAVTVVHVVGRSAPALRAFASAFRQLSSTTCITSDQAPPGKNSADVLAALWLGTSSRQVPALRRVYVLSRDSLIIAVAKRALGVQSIVVPADASPRAIESLKTLRLPQGPIGRSRKTEARPPVPAWATDCADPTNSVGLEWVGVSADGQANIPEFVPFPARRSPVVLGSGGGADVDIDLGAWAPAGCLYSRHVVFEYTQAPASCWTLRSTHGHRTGKRKVSLGERLINAEIGPQALRPGVAIDLGPMSFRFRDNRLLNHIWFENPKDMMERLERGFCILASGVPLGALPAKVGRELVEGADVLWERAFIRHYIQLFSEIWSKALVEWVDATFRSRSEIKRELGALNRVRNVLFHPSRGAVADDDLSRLAELYLRFQSSPGWPDGLSNGSRSGTG